MTIHRLLLTGLCAALALPLASGSALAQAFETGDALVLDLTGNRIIRVRLTDGPTWNAGDQDVVSSGGPVAFPRGLAIATESNGALFITSDLEVVRVKADEDRQDFVTVFGSVPRDITFDESEQHLFVTQPYDIFSPSVFRVDRVTGGQEIVAQGLVFPRGIERDPSDPTKLLVVDSQVLGEYGRGVYRVDPEAFDVNAQGDNLTLISQHGEFSFPRRLAAIDSGEQCEFPPDPAPPDEGLLIYVTDPGLSGDPPKVVQVARDWGAADCPYQQVIVASGGHLVRPLGIAIEPSGTLLVADAYAQAVIRIDPDYYDSEHPTNNQEIVSPTGGGQDFFDRPWEIRIVPDLSEPPLGDLLVTDAGPTPAETGVFTVSPGVGRTELATGAEFSLPAGAVVDHAEPQFLVVVDEGNQTVHRVPRDGSTPILVASGAPMVAPTNVVVEADGSYIVTDPEAKMLIRVDPAGPVGSNQQIVSPQGNGPDLFKRPMATKILDNGKLLVADAGDPDVDDDGRLIEVSPVLGQQFCLYQGSRMEEVTDIVRDSDGSYVLAAASGTPVQRLTSLGFVDESVSSEYQSPGGVAIDANRDILVVDAGDPDVPGDGRVLRLDPLESEPSVVGGSEDLSDPFGIALAADPQPPAAFVDQDGDGVSDEDDNCVETANPEQWNANPDDDVYGDDCDADFDDDGYTGAEDFILLVNAFWSSEGDSNYDPRVDLYSDGWIGVEELTVMVKFWGKPPGPAGIRVGVDPVGPCTDPAPSP